MDNNIIQTINTVLLHINFILILNMHLLILLSSDQFLFKEVANVSKAMIIDLDAHQVMKAVHNVLFETKR